MTVARQLSVASPTADEMVLWPLAVRLFEQVWPVGQPVRLLESGGSGLEVPARFSLWASGPAGEAAKEMRVQRAPAAATRLGPDVVRRVSQLPPLIPKD